MDDQVARLLAGRRVATAESCTAGLLAARLTERPGSSAYIAGGVVAYANEAKVELLGVDPALIAAQGAVSEPVAEAMAAGALRRFGADTAIAITGIAGPDGGSQDKPVGTVCCSVMLANGPTLTRTVRLPGERTDVRIVYLKGERDLIARRLAARDGHFMPPSLLDSQFATLEEPRSDEHPIVVSIVPHPREIVEEIVNRLGKGAAPSFARNRRRAIAGRRS